MRCPNCGHVITRSQNASNYFHKLRDLYAGATGLDTNHAKADLKILYGVRVDIEHPSDIQKIPTDTPGEFVEGLGDRLYWLKSEAVMTKEEHNRLIEGSERACLEVGAELPA